VRCRTSLSSDNARDQSKTTADIAQLTFELVGERHQALLKITKLGCLLLKLSHPASWCETGPGLNLLVLCNLRLDERGNSESPKNYLPARDGFRDSPPHSPDYNLLIVTQKRQTSY
jgi:hypothetical protein